MANHLILFDADCGLCNRCNQFVLDQDRRAVFAFASLLGTLGREKLSSFGVRPDRPETFYLVVDYGTANAKLLGRSDAAFRVVGELGWPWKSALIFLFVPKRVRDALYELVARNRHRLFRNTVCRIPDEETRRRFLDV